MIFRFMVEVEVKNDSATQEMERTDLALMLLNVLESNRSLDAIPWVIARHYELIKE
jgi:hypothetical protein